MSKVRLRSVNDNWGGVLNLVLGSTMTTEECLEIVKKLDDVCQNKFYTINVWDSNTNRYLGDIELFKNDGDYTLICNYIGNSYIVHIYRYIFSKSGIYTRAHTTQELKIQDILSRLDKIEQKLNEITTSETN